MDYTGQLIENRYRLIRPLGEGGMGAVYLARHILIEKEVAIKLLHSDLSKNQEVLKRFFREAKASANLKHKGIVEVFDMGVTEWGEPYLAMEYLQGESLSTILRRLGSLKLPAVLGIISPLLEALTVTHRKGIIHRDIKPSNIFIAATAGEPPEVKLIDFGISKVTRADTRLTQTGTVIGTLDYMAPEQLRGETDITEAADLWAVAVVFYELLTGALPFTGKNFNARYLNVLTKPHISPREFVPGCPEPVEMFLSVGLAKDFPMRFGSARDMLSTLEKLPGYEERESVLSEVVERTMTARSAARDLGERAIGGEGVAAKAMMKMIVEGRTPRPRGSISGFEGDTRADTGGMSGRPPAGDKWTGTSIDSSKRRRKTFLPIGIAGVVATMAVLTVLWLNRESVETEMNRVSSKNDPAAPQPAASDVAVLKSTAGPGSAPIDEVTFTIRVEPEDAVVFFDEEKRQQRFFVRRSTEPSMLKVERAGYLPYLQKVVPSESQLVSVRLEPVPAAPMEKEGTSVTATGGTGEKKSSNTLKRKRKRRETETSKQNTENAGNKTEIMGRRAPGIDGDLSK